MRNNEEKLYERITLAICIGLLIQVVIGYIEVRSHRYLFNVGSFKQIHYGREAISMFYNPNDYSAFISTMMPFAAYRCMKSRNLFLKIGYGALVLAALNLILITASRAAIVGLMLSVGALFSLFAEKDRTKIITLIAVAAGICIIIFVPSVRQWALRLASENGVDADGSDVGRVNLLKNGLYFLMETYGFGVGAGNLEVWFENRSIYPIGRLLYIHNWYAEILVTFGVIVFVYYMVVHGSIMLETFRVARKEKSFFFLISFIIFSATSIASSSNVYSEWVWMYLAMMTAYLEKYRTVSKVEVKV